MRFVTLAVASILLAGCSCATPAEVTDDDADTPRQDAAMVDAAVAAGACTPAGARVWRLGDGVWSTDFAPRGVASPYVVAAAHDGEIYLAGQFDYAGPIAAHNVAVWSETEGFRTLGDELVADFASDIVVAPDGSVIVTSAHADTTGFGETFELNLLRGGTWSTIGQSDVSIGPLALDTDGSVLVGGSVTPTSGSPTGGLSRWDGSTLTPIATPHVGISTILADDHGLCIAGFDAGASFLSCRAIGEAAWTGLPLPSGSMTAVNALVRDSTGALVLGSSDVFRLEGSTWTPLGGGLVNAGTSLTVNGLVVASDGAIWAMGDFEGARLEPGVELLRAARWDGTAWSPVGTPVGGPFTRFFGAVRGDDVLFIGSFDEIDAAHPISALGIARWDGARWHALDQPGATTLGTGGISRLAVSPSCETYVGGRFRALGDLESHYVGRLGENAWSAVGSALPPPGETNVLAIAPDGTLFAAGLGVSVLGPPPWIAGLRGDGWVPLADLGSDLAGREVDAIVFLPDGTMVIGGRLDGGILASSGMGFTPLGTNDWRPIEAMLVTDDSLLVADGHRISRWDGASWSVVVADTGFTPHAMIEWHGHVVVGGDYGLAFLRGTTLDAVMFPDIGSAHITALAGLGEQLIAVGSRGDNHGAELAMWSDPAGNWHDFGFDGPVDDVAVLDGALLFVGDFTTVGGIASAGVARLDAP